jgi:hypothetical protein
MNDNVIGTFSFVHDGIFDKVGHVTSITKHTKSIEVDVCDFTLDDARKIWGIIAKQRVRISIIDLEDYTEYICSVQGTLNLFYGDGISYFTLKVEHVRNINDDEPDEDICDRPATSA